METSLREGKLGKATQTRSRKNGERFTRPRGHHARERRWRNTVGYLSNTSRRDSVLTEQLQATQFYTRSLIESSIDAL